MALAPGTSIDRYVVEHLLGEGAMAEVYCVRHGRLGSRHALKVLRDPSPYLAARLLKEGRAQSQLQHHHLLPVRDILDIQGRPALLMPLVEGPSLDALLRTHRLGEAEAIAIFRCIVEGLSFAHRRGVVHRDLKPANVLLEVRLGLVWPLIADFGVVKMEEEGGDKTRDGAAVGTPAYAAPEQLRDAARVTPQADLFSLGVMLAELLTGTRPFAGGPLAQILDAHRLPPRLGEMGGPLRTLVEDLLQIEPARRPASCEVVLARLPATSSADRSGPALLNAMQRAAERPSEDSSVATTLAPPTLASPNLRHNLPPPRDRFVGREAELASLRRHLSEGQRLVTLLGTGGIGKSRLSLELAREVLEEWPGGVWFCELAEARTAEGIVTAMATALEVPLGKDPDAQLADVILGRGQALFILDNFEQITPFAARTVGRWMDRAPDAHFVVTSRERLRLRGERVVMVDVLGEEEAAALFTERAKQADDRFEIAPGEEPAVRTLLALLDRLPLAIELAAARSRLLSPPEMLSRMARRFKLLTSRSPDLPPRQRTLQAALEWSWELLEPHEQSALAQCSVFEGGFTLLAAESVIEAEGERWVEEVLAELVDKSLLVSRKGRLSMLTSVQDFAREKLVDPGEVVSRHGRWFAQMGTEAAVEALHRSGGVERGWALWADRDNLVVAARRAVARGDVTCAAGCALAGAEVFEARGPLLDGAELLAFVLRLPSLPVDDRVRLSHKEGVLLRIAGQSAQAEQALLGALDLDRGGNGGRRHGGILVDLGALHREQGHMDVAMQHLQEALSLSRALGHRRLERQALLHLGILHSEQSRMDVALQHYEQALALSREAGDRKIEGRVLGNLGNLHREQGRAELALGFFARALAIFHELGDRRGEAIALGNTSGLHLLRGRMDAALQDSQRSLSISREIGDRRFEALALLHRGNLYRRLGRLDVALRDYEVALPIHREIGDRLFEGYAFANMGVLYKDQGRLDVSLQSLRQALAIFVETGGRLGEGFVLNHIGIVQFEQGRIEEAQQHYERALSVHREVGDRSHEGLALSGLGALCHHQGRTEEALQHLLRALAIERDVGDREFESQALGNLGDVYFEQGEMELAREHYQQALCIAAEFGYRRYEGIALGKLGRLQGARGDAALGRITLGQGEALLREVGDLLSLAVLLCHRATLEAEDHQADAGRTALREAREIAHAQGSAPRSSLGRALQAAEQSQSPRVS
ncbi:MAG: tetratricopeptide repeat protein [Pseudomonadota bacterium]|nr:tetratricopeptide repeat protein [Pseudomonadota bacterium]